MEIVVTSPSFSRHPTLRYEISQLGLPVKFNETGERPQGKALSQYIGNAEIAIVSLEHIDAFILENCKQLKLIAKFGVGLDNIDLIACERLNVKIGWQPGTNSLSVAELTLSFMLSLMRNVFYTSTMLKNNVWNKLGGSQLSGKTIGIMGVSYVGKEIIRLLKPFHCRILVNDLADITHYAKQENITAVDFDTLIRESDIVSLHVPLTEKTNGMINHTVLKKMKSSAFLINTARGKLIVENDLKEALINHQIAGAALDVFEQEPPSDLSFLQLSNIICTPHIAGNSNEAVLAMGRAAITNIKEYIKQ